MARLSDRDRAALPDRAFAYIDGTGRRLLPIHDVAHVRNALARFGQVRFESEAARHTAMQRVLRAARKHGIVPVGFFTRQLSERTPAERSLPDGLLTLMFTDIEGSTGLVRSLGDGYAPYLDRVRRIIGRAVSASSGHEVEVRADEYFAVFERPESAVAAAIEVQRSIGRTRWDDPQHPVRVRIGLHTGRVTLSDLGYLGLPVHAAARVCAAAHGAQIVISAVTARAARGSLAEGVALQPLGKYALAGLGAPLGLYQVEATDLRADFAPLRATQA
ncbi:MAG TPA: adenylate/guanylate cyclase domain-containing protein [Acidimicrobiia bacterium]|nr:adenylate/guanylate cyclase domain-containing protein [Acidimicrobiia bacterium]